MANRRMKRCSASLIIREIQIKTTARYHLTSIRLAKINNTRNNRRWREYEERGNSSTVGGNAIWNATVENSMEVPQK